ncbi:growth/differentiation factor 8-like [Thrips palmi]|uniref:Growth/differentiation factor 8-like n=1 Tax=Thrips palmi TaxID=161013 RepID=A0A6P8ZL78_THRPL|nr:growth/differentiation factor 8-like [Thrips palmi]
MALTRACMCGHTARHTAVSKAVPRAVLGAVLSESPSASPTPAPHAHRDADPAFREDTRTARSARTTVRAVGAVPPPSRASRTWRRPSSWMAALLVVALVCTLPACSLAERAPTSRSATSTPSAVGKYPLDEDSTASTASALRAQGARRAQTRELDESLEQDAEPSRGRRPSSDLDDDAAKLLPDRRSHKGGRGARKQQRKRPRDDDMPPLGQSSVLGGCNMCQEREAIRNWSLAAIKEQILHKLNLQQPPNITGRRLPPYDQVAYDLLHQPPNLGGNGMLGDDPDAYRTEQFYEEDDDYHAKTERIIAFPQTHMNKVRHRAQDADVLHFRFSPKVMQSQVAKATLWLFVRGTGVHRHYHNRHHRHPHRDPHRDDAEEDEDSVEEEEEEVEEEVPPQVVVNVLRMRNREHVQFDVEATVKVARPEGEGVWVMVDINKMVEDWFRRPSHNLGLSVHAHLHGGLGSADGRPLIDTDADGDNLKMPFIEVYLKESPKRRSRRAVGLDCDENSEESRCCRYPLVVDFELFGWDFIIFPKKYEANYCSGECPFVYMQKYPHTALMHLANNKTGPCCAPRKMSPINMLYFDNDLNVVFGVLPGMVVERCGCF